MKSKKEKQKVKVEKEQVKRKHEIGKGIIFQGGKNEREEAIKVRN